LSSACYVEINGVGRDVQKHPVEMDHFGILKPSFKKSKAGRLKLIHTEDGFKTVREGELPEYRDELSTVFENGEIIHEQSFENIRKRLAEYKPVELCLK
jgi:nicotinamide phosphoribosyltransferase